jgi:arsenite methyltransferase
VTINDADEVRTVVREHYAQAAREAGTSSCCADRGKAPGTGPGHGRDESGKGPDAFGRSAYEPGDQRVLPEAALVASLGCGNPTVSAPSRTSRCPTQLLT